MELLHVSRRSSSKYSLSPCLIFCELLSARDVCKMNTMLFWQGVVGMFVAVGEGVIHTHVYLFNMKEFWFILFQFFPCLGSRKNTQGEKEYYFTLRANHDGNLEMKQLCAAMLVMNSKSLKDLCFIHLQ